MKILSISNMELWPFGPGKGIPSVSASQDGLARRGHEVVFCCPLKNREDPLEEVTESGVKIVRYRLPFNISSRSVYGAPQGSLGARIKSKIIYNLEWLFIQFAAFFAGKKLAREIEPDIIYAHSTTPLLPAYFVSRVCRTKLVARIYGMRFWEFQSFWSRLRRFRDYGPLRLPVDAFIITNDGTEGDRICRRQGVTREKIKYWRNGVDGNIFETDPAARQDIVREFNLPEDARIIVSLSRLVEFYGIDELVKALLTVFPEVPNAYCLMAGDGPLKVTLEKMVEENGLSGRIIFVGVRDHAFVKKMFNAADLYVFLSQRHNCTNTMWEAMATGKCIVTTETEAIREVLTDGENARLLSRDREEEIPRVIKELLLDDALRSQMGERARSRAREVLETWDQRIAREAEFLEALVKTNG